MKAQDFATAHKQYRIAADSSRGVTGLEQVRAEALRGFAESGVKLAEQRKAQGKLPEAEEILREILAAPYDPKNAMARRALVNLHAVAPKIKPKATGPPVDKEATREIPTIFGSPPRSTEAAESRPPGTRASPATVTRGPASEDVPHSLNIPEKRTPLPPPITTTTEKRGTPPPAASPAATAARDGHLVKVYFGTDRRPTGGRGPSGCFGIDWNNQTPDDPVVTGVVTVSIPRGHKEGIIERPPWYWPRSEDPAKDFVLKELRISNSGQFYEELRADFGQRAEEERSAFVYIHGYNVTFDDAAYATAQIVFDLDFKGVPMMFSWPSQGRVLAYDGDQETVDFSAPNLEAFLGRVARETGATRIHLMAHSMGNRVLTRALAELVRQPDIQPLFENVIMASPDLNAQLFTRLWPKIKVAAKRFTLYASSDDKALSASRTAKGGSNFTRLGEAGPNIVVIPGLDTIDASGIDTSELGHSYEFTCKPVRTDLWLLIGKGFDPQKRQLRLNQGSLGFWRFPSPE